MKNKLLKRFKTRFNLDDDFMIIVESLFEKLLDFGYISKSIEKKLLIKLNENIDYLFFGTDEEHDYKSGFYDADKKTMYIQNKTSVPAIYLRLIYAITSSEIDVNTHNMGFSTTYMSKTSYKLMYRNFAINRAIIANLVCRLLGTVDNTMKLIPGYKTYNHNFFGYEILTDNDIYSFEGHILSQMCFSTGIDEEVFYSYLFTKSPVASMNKTFNKTKFIDKVEFLTLFDNTSKLYSAYCKLNYFSNLLNQNYIDHKKKDLDEDILNNLDVVKAKISRKIRDFIGSTNKKNSSTDDDLNYELETSLSATLEDLEKNVLENTIKIQDILANNIITGISYLSPYLYANRLKEFNSLIIIPNKKLEDAIFHTIMFKLVPDHETTTTNIIQKMRYCIISSILETEKLTKVSNKVVFNRVESEIAGDHEEIAIVTVNNIFANIIKISDMNKPITATVNKMTNIQTDNLKYIINSDTSGKFGDKATKIFSYLKDYFIYLKKVSLDNIYIFNLLNKEYIVVNTNSNIFLFEIIITNDKTYSLEPITLSNGFSLFDLKKKKQNTSNLPTLYKEKTKLFGFIKI